MARLQSWQNPGNNQAPLYGCRKWGIEAGKLVYKGMWQSGELEITEAIDPDGRKKLTFSYWKGNIVLERSIISVDTVMTRNKHGSALQGRILL